METEKVDRESGRRSIADRLRYTRLLMKQFSTIRSYRDFSLRFPAMPLIGRPVRPKRLIYVVSIPRSGSSWVGKTIGRAPNCLYLREPLSQSYRHIDPNTQACFELDCCKYPKQLNLFADRAFKGIPVFDRSVVNDRARWRSLDTPEALVIKEVNPLILSSIASKYNPRVVFIVRHPAAIALSMYSKGWRRDPFEQRFSPRRWREIEEQFYVPPGTDYWERHGAFQGIVQTLSMEALARMPLSKVVRYEDLCLDPLSEFEAIFKFCQLQFSESVRAQIVADTTERASYEIGKFDTRRNSRAMIGRWRHDIAPDRLARIKRGYLANSPGFYTTDLDWTL